MNITHVVESLGRGGLERMVLDLVESQHNQGHKCQIICLFTAGELIDEAKNKGIECIVCNKKKGIDLSALIRLRNAIKKQKTEIIHTHNSVAHYYAYFATFKMNFKCLINTRHGMGARDPNAKREKHFKRTLNRTNYVVAVCEAAKKKLVQDKLVSEDKCVVVLNGINVKQYMDTKKNDKSEKNSTNVENGNVILGSVGRLNWAKDYFTLLDAFKILRKEFKKIELVIVGGGTLDKELHAHASKIGVSRHVKFLGDTIDVKPSLREFDIFVSSSVSEGYSIALLEACVAGIPIVATDVGGSPEIVQHGKNGLIVPPRDPMKLAKSLAILITDKDCREKYSKYGQDWAVQHGDIAQMAYNYDRLYTQALYE